MKSEEEGRRSSVHRLKAGMEGNICSEKNLLFAFSVEKVIFLKRKRGIKTDQIDHVRQLQVKYGILCMTIYNKSGRFNYS